MKRAAARLRVIVPMTLAVIVLLLHLYFRNLAEVAMLMARLPFALLGGIWLLYLLDYHYGVAIEYERLTDPVAEEDWHLLR